MAAPVAAPAPWMPLLHELVTSELASEQAHNERVGELVALFRGSSGGGAAAPAPTPVVRLVEALGPFLTNENDGQRARAASILAEVVESVPASVRTPGEVSHLCQFFASRLTDWPAVRGALCGCLALVTRRPAPPGTAPPAGQAADVAAPAGVDMAPGDAEVAELMRTCVSNVFVRALAQPDRALALRLLAEAVLRYGGALLAANLDLLEYLISSVDGEKDPRCLLLSFEAVQRLLDLYHRQPEESLCHERLEESAEELFEVLACYFPITFNPPPGDANRITREDLAAGLQASLAAEPLFAPHLVPLAMEKLSSALRQAKLDSLSLLAACAESYGLSPLASHVSTLWAALRAELAAPAAEGLLPADLPAADEMAAAAAACLSRCVAAFQGRKDGGGTAAGVDVPAGASLADAVLADPLVHDMLACIRSPGQDAAVHRRSALRARAGARATEALCRAGGMAASKALAPLLPPLQGIVGVRVAATKGSSAAWQSQCLAWAALLELLQAAGAAAAAQGAQQPAAVEAGTAAGPAATVAVDAGMLQQVVGAAASALAAAAAAAAAMEVDAETGVDAEEQQPASDSWPLTPAACTQAHATTLQLETLAAVFSSPPLAAALQPEQVKAAVDDGALQLLAAPGGLPEQQQAAAVAALTALAGSAHGAVLADTTLSRLVTAAGQKQSAAAALLAMQALAAASSSLRVDIVAALNCTIQQQMAAALKGTGSGSDSAAELLLLQLVRAASIIIAASSPQHSAAAGAAAAASATAEPPSAGAVEQLAYHLLVAAEPLSPPAAATASPAVQEACAELAYHAQRVSSAARQAGLAAAAAQALQGQGSGAQQAVGLEACIACAMLVPLRPEAVSSLPGGLPAALVQRLVSMALGQQQPQQQQQQQEQQQGHEAPLARWAALAAASLLNKWPGDADSLSSCASFVLQGQLYPACGLATAAGEDGTSGSSGAAPAANPAAWGCLAAVCRALAMRGHRGADAALGRAISSLDGAAQRWEELEAEAALQGGAGASSNSSSSSALAMAGAAAAAANYLGGLLEGSSGGGARPGLGKQSFATSRPLWQQRLYTAALSQLLPLLQCSLEAAAGRPNAAAAAPPQSAAGSREELHAHRPAHASPPLLLALAHLLQSAPSGVVQQDQRRLLPWLLQCLAALQRGPLAEGELLQALLLLLSTALMSDAGRQQAEAELLPALVPALLELSRYRASPAVRETALQCLLLLLEFPYSSLHPYRRTVGRVLAAAVDDNRRSVRLQAARVRQAWNGA